MSRVPMHIVMLSDMETKGGAAISATRLALALCKAGHRVTRIVSVADGSDQPWSTQLLRTPYSPYWRGARYLLPSSWQKGVNNGYCRNALKGMLAELRPDVINVHNLHEASWIGWNEDLVEVCIRYAPTVWTLHDMWSFTGRCAYNYDCRRFLIGCDATCPTPNEYPALEPGRIAGAWRSRKRLLEAHTDLVAVTPSRWLASEALAGLWAGHCVEVIPYGLPLDLYCPLDRKIAREAMGLGKAETVILVAGADLTQRRKGTDLLLQALRECLVRPLTLVTMGAGRFALNVEGISVHSLGYVDHERTRVLAYNASSLLVHPAPVDNLPNVVLESIACGTPVVGFPIGGVVDLVRPGRSGWLAQECTPQALASALLQALNDLTAGIDLRSSCRVVAESEYPLSLQADSYLSLFQRLVWQRSSR